MNEKTVSSALRTLKCLSENEEVADKVESVNLIFGKKYKSIERETIISEAI